MKLREKRIAFSIAISQLILWATGEGMEVCFDREGLPHMKNSLHYKGLAKDINLYRNGEYMTATEDYRALGEKWETMHPLARWGGSFSDGNHFSFEHEGVK